MPISQHVVNSDRPRHEIAPLQIVAHTKSFHQSAAMHAARMIGYQYTREAKNEFRRECIDCLKASLAGGAA